MSYVRLVILSLLSLLFVVLSYAALICTLTQRPLGGKGFDEGSSLASRDVDTRWG